jgi:hypothetical protein
MPYYHYKLNKYNHNVNEAQVLDNNGVVILEDFYEFCIRKRIDYLSETIQIYFTYEEFFERSHWPRSFFMPDLKNLSFLLQPNLDG